MWNAIKRGFGYGFGGRIGWELGGLIWKWVSRGVALVALGLMAQCGAHNYTAGAAKAKAQQTQAAPAKAQQHKQAKPKAADTVLNPTAATEWAATE